MNTAPNSRLRWLVPLLAMLCWPAVLASPEEADDESIDTVTVIATRTERALDEVAATVSVKIAEDIDRELARDIADLVRFEPGVSVAGTGSRFGLTGFRIRGIGGNRVLTLIDGVRIPEEFSFGPFLSARRDLVDIDSLERVEIARGPISSLYGSDALGGVVAFTTKGPRGLVNSERPFAATFKGGHSAADDSFVGTATLVGEAGGLAGMMLYTRRSGSETDNAGSVGGNGAARERPDPQSIDLENLTAKVAVEIGDDQELTLGLDRYVNDTETRVLSDYGSVVFGTVVDRRDADDTRDRHRWSLNYRFNGDLRFADRIDATLYAQRADTGQTTHEDRTTRTRAQQTRLRVLSYEQRIDGLSVQLGRRFDVGRTDHRLTYGADYSVTESASIRDGGTFDASGAPVREFSPLPTRDFPLTEVVQLAAFAQDEIRLFDNRLQVSPGFRFDRFKADARADDIYIGGNPGSPVPQDYDDSEVTAKVGARYAISDAVSVYARYSEGFRAPPYDDVNVGFTNFLGGYKTIANPDLESERSQGVEAGLRLASRVGDAHAAYFRNTYDDFIESLALAPAFLRSGGIDPVDGLRTFQSLNRAHVEIHGWEAGGSFALQSGLSARFAAAFASGEDRETGEALNSIDPLTLIVGLGYERPDGPWGFEIVCTLTVGKDEADVNPDEGRLPTPGYGIVDVLAHVDFGDRVRLHAGLFNLADKDYIRWADTAAIGGDAAARFTQPGRNAGITLTVEL